LIPFNKLRCARNGNCSLQELNIDRLAAPSSCDGWLWWFGRGCNLRSCNDPRGGERARAFKAISPGMLTPLGIIFGLFVVFTAAQLWQDDERANREMRAPQFAARAT
jgi:hypothetical protein